MPSNPTQLNGGASLTKSLTTTGATRAVCSQLSSPWQAGSKLLAFSAGAAVLTGAPDYQMTDAAHVIRLQAEAATDAPGTRKLFAVPAAAIAALATNIGVASPILPGDAAVTTGAAYLNAIVAIVPRGYGLQCAVLRERIAYGGSVAAGQWKIADNAGTKDGIAFYEDVPLGYDVVLIVPTPSDITALGTTAASVPKAIDAMTFIATVTAAATLMVAPRN